MTTTTHGAENEEALLVTTVEQVLTEAQLAERAPGERWWVAGWRALEDLGLTLVGQPERAGGSGGTTAQAAAIVRAAARCGAVLPLGEACLLGAWLLVTAGCPIPSGPLTAACQVSTDVRLSSRRGSWVLDGVVRRVPYGGVADTVVLLVDGPAGPMVAAVDRDRVTVRPGHNLAGEPRDDLRFDGVALSDDHVAPAAHEAGPAALRCREALTRTVQMAGAADRVLELALLHARDREQFGRPIGQQQAVQQLLAVLAAEVTALTLSADAAVAALDEAADPNVLVAAAKANASERAGEIAAIGHQVHGAIGFTTEHELHRSTTRLWAWREEGGNEAEWQDDLGRAVLDVAGPRLWATVADRTLDA